MIKEIGTSLLILHEQINETNYSCFDINVWVKAWINIEMKVSSIVIDQVKWQVREQVKRRLVTK